MNYKAARLRKNFVHHNNGPSSSHYHQPAEEQPILEQQYSFCASFSAGYGFNTQHKSDSVWPHTNPTDESRSNWRLKQLFNGRPALNLTAYDGKRPQSAEGKTFPSSSTLKNFVPFWKKAKIMQKKMAKIQQSPKSNGQWAKVYVGDLKNVTQKKKKKKNKKRKSEVAAIQYIQLNNGAQNGVNKKKEPRQQFFLNQKENLINKMNSPDPTGSGKKNNKIAQRIPIKEKQFKKEKKKSTGSK